MNDIREKFQEILDKKFWSFWNRSLSEDRNDWLRENWHGWLEENKIKKMRNEGEYSKVRIRCGLKVTEHHLCCFNRSASTLSDERHPLLLVPYDLAFKSVVLGGLP